jgi:DNA (cytosine-5)-methyltransferase 1
MDANGARNRTANRRPGAKIASIGTTLTDAIHMWATPTARDWKDGDVRGQNVPTNGLLGRQTVRWDSTHLDETTTTAGEKSSPSPRVLNPLFSEWLMGWPEGWSDPASPIDASDWHSWETASCRSLSQPHGATSSRGCDVPS